MAASKTLDVVHLLATQKFSRWHLLTLSLCFVVLFIDGMDFNAVNVGAPAILRAWHAEKSAIGLVFGVGNLGILIGTFVFSWIGDRYGRRWGVVLGVLTYSLPALITPFAASPIELAAFRFLAGCGIGGVVPNCIAILTEIAPAKLRASFVVVPFMGYGIGTAAIGGIAAGTIPLYGWQSVFLVAGGAGTLLAFVLLLWLPESIRFLTLTDPDAPNLRHRVARLLPGRALPPETRLTLPNQIPVRFSIRMLFSRDLKLATILLWLAFFAEALTFITMLGWLTVMLEGTGLSPVQASLTFAYGAMGSIVTQLVMAKLLDRFGMGAALVMALIAIIAFVVFGAPNLPATTLIGVAIVMSAAAGAVHNSLNGLVGAYYPTNIRGNAVGFATGMGRIAAVIGPVIAGYFLATSMPLRELSLVLVSPYAVVVICCYMLGRRYKTNLARDGVSDAPAPAPGFAAAAAEIKNAAL